VRRHCAQKLNRKHNVTYMHMPRLRAYELRVLHPIRFEYATHNLSAMHTRCIAKCSHKRMRIILRSSLSILSHKRMYACLINYECVLLITFSRQISGRWHRCVATAPYHKRPSETVLRHRVHGFLVI
jgi:hypothetical protein